MGISQKWKDTVNRGIDDARWDEYDDLIKKEVNRLNVQLAKTPQFVKMDWLFIKAILWTESGGPDNESWKTRVMQIGNPGDPAYKVLKDGEEGSLLIMDSALYNDFKKGKNTIDKPEVNVKAAIAYLYTRMAKFENKSTYDEKDTKVYDYKVIKGDNSSAIAKKVGTTLDELNSRNPGMKAMIKPGQVLKYRKASMRLAIAGWRTVSTVEIASRYNWEATQITARSSITC